MQVFPVRARHTRLFAILLFVGLAVCGCKKKELYAVYPCGDIAITVDHTKPNGVDHKGVYLCSDNVKKYTITWVRGPKVDSFQVVFVGPDLPFGPKNTTFGTGGSTTTPPLPDPGELTVFKYNIKIIDTSGAKYQFDPHVVGGGGLATNLSADFK